MTSKDAIFCMYWSDGVSDEVKLPVIHVEPAPSVPELTLSHEYAKLKFTMPDPEAIGIICICGRTAVVGSQLCGI